MAADCAEPASFHHRTAAVSVRRCEDLQIPGAALFRQHPAADLRGRPAGARARRALDDRASHTSGGVHPGRRNGIRLFHGSHVQDRRAGVSAAAQQWHRTYPVLLLLSLSGDFGRRTDQRRCRYRQEELAELAPNQPVIPGRVEDAIAHLRIARFTDGGYASEVWSGACHRAALRADPVGPSRNDSLQPRVLTSSGTAASYLELCSTSEVLTLRTCGAAVRWVTKS